MIVSDIDTYTDLTILDMLDFDVIFGMDLLSHNYALMDCFSNTNTLAMASVPQAMLQEAISNEATKIISYVCPTRLISRGFESYLFNVCDYYVKS